jgi:ferric hydroxamate/heme transport system permease protein
MNRATTLRPNLLLLVMSAALLAAAAVSLELGSTQLSAAQVFAALVGRGEWTENLIVLQMRLPRLVLSALIGAGLAVAGALLQGLSRNDLASPSTVGVDAGAGLGIMLALVLAPLAAARLPWVLPLAAVGGAMVVTLLVFALAYRRGSVLPSRLLLVGIAVGFGADAAMLLLSLRMDFVTYSRVVSWMSGTLASADWRSIRFLLPCCLVLLPAAFSRARVLNAFALGDGVAKSLGVRVEQQRLIALALATTIASACAAIGGQIAFLGLVAPHLARRLVGYDHRVLFPAAALCGATLLVVADSLGRSLFAPIEMPAGVLVGVLGGAYFLYLLSTTKG